MIKKNTQKNCIFTGQIQYRDCNKYTRILLHGEKEQGQMKKTHYKKVPKYIRFLGLS